MEKNNIKLIKEVKVMRNEEKSFSKTSINWYMETYEKTLINP